MRNLCGQIIFLCCLAAAIGDNAYLNYPYCYNLHQIDVVHDIAWVCDLTSQKCVRTIIEDNKNSTECFMSLKVCRILCDEYASLWPKPSNFSWDRKLKPIDVGNIAFESKLPNKNNELWSLLESLKHYFVDTIGFEFREKPIKEIKGELKVVFSLQDTNTILYTNGAEENYKLEITSNKHDSLVNIVASNYLGIRHGIETLTQLIVYDEISNLVLIPTVVTIEDSPAYGHRGILLDTARSYISVGSIKRLLDAMAYNKLNTFHWHLTDSQSFPFESKTYPKMSRYGAYSQSQVYSRSSIKDIVHYAKIRGIRVIPELDTPSHVGEGWQLFSKEENPVILCYNSKPWTDFCVEPVCGILNPVSPKVYEILKNLYAEFEELFESDLFHMGGDEVSFRCWNQTDVIIDWIKKYDRERNQETFTDLWASFHNKAKGELDAVTSSKKKKIILWTSTLTESQKLTQYLDPNRFIIQIWTKGDDEQIVNLLNNGYEVILSNYDALYFDCGFGAWIGEGNNWCSPYIGWQKVYMNRPDELLKNLNDNYGINRTNPNSLILGAEATLWSEQIDSNSMDGRLWPRASALAERMWSNPKTDWKAAKNRILFHKERMSQRNIAAEQLGPTWCLQNQGECE